MTPGLFPTKADYARESKQARKGDFRKLRIKQTRLPSQAKSKNYWCRNCNKQLPLGKQFNPCPQCDHVNKKPLERPMK